MGDQEDRSALVHESTEQLGERLLVLVVHAGRRLVHDEEVGVARESPRDEHALLLTAGQLGERGSQPVDQADPGDRSDDGVVVRLAGRDRRTADARGVRS